MKKKTFLLLILALAALLFFGLDLHRFLSFEALKSGRETLSQWYSERPLTMIGGYFFSYILITALSLPGAVVMTLAGGALFGLGLGSLLVSFASSIGATLAFLAGRFLLRDLVQRRFGERLTAFNRGMAEDGGFYLFSLRLVPIFPFFIINLVMALTPIRVLPYYWISQIGMLPATLVFVNAGTQLGQLESPAGILSPPLLASFALLGLFPIFTRWFSRGLKRRRLYQPWPKPDHFDRNLVVIGAGAGGLVSAYLAATVRAKVSLIESGAMGGDCLNTGCVPSKTLIRSSRLLRQIRAAANWGLDSAEARVDFPRLMARIQASIDRVAPHDSVGRYTALGVEVIQGRARITSPWTVTITETDGSIRSLSTRAMIIATGAAPVPPQIPGLDAVPHYTSETIWSLATLPRRLVILGGGPIGCELGQAFAALGSEVSIVLRGSRLLAKEDDEAAALVAESLIADGVRLLTGATPVACEWQENESQLVLQSAQGTEALPFDALLCATGRQPRTSGFGLEELGIPLSKNGVIQTNRFLQTIYPNIYACGDVAGPYQFTHTAGHQAWYAVANALFAPLKRFAVDYRAVPRVTFTTPEVAQVGLTEADAKAAGIPVEVSRFDLAELDRAITEGETKGLVKLLTKPGSDRILGALIVGGPAGEMLAELSLAIRHGIGLNKILATIHPYPTWSEAVKLAAGQWKKAHTPETLLAWLGRFHRFRRGGER